MILKFDHISYISARKYIDKILADKGEPKFKEIGLHNISNKFPLMKEKSVDHDLFFFEGEMPTEYIFYDFVCGQSTITVSSNMIYGHYKDKEKAIEFLNSIFPGKVISDLEKIRCKISGIMDKKIYEVELSYKPQNLEELHFLDMQGYGVPAIIYSGTMNKQFWTEENHIEVNGKIMSISFAYCNYVDLVFEMIRIEKFK